MIESRSSVSSDAWVIEAGRLPGLRDRVADLWRYRRAAGFFFRRSIQLLYARTQLGWPWLLIRPLAPLCVGALVYGGVMGVPSLHVPYFLFFLAGSIAWSVFEGSLQWGTRSLERNRHLVKKLYLPRAILPVASTGAGLVEALVLLGVLVVAVTYYRRTDDIWYLAPPAVMAVAPAVLLLAWLQAVALAFWTSLWQARTRDTRYVLGFVVSFWAFLTPVIYPVQAMPLRWQPVAFVNPMTAVVEGFRGATLGAGVISPGGLAWSTALTLVLLFVGLRHFARAEGAATDRL
jgi:lipopolysaccharide transport system permease protein